MVAHDQKSPLEMAIKNRQMDFWNIMRENTELTENEKLVQLHRMIVVESVEEDTPSKEFKELLSSLPVEMVILEGAIYAIPPPPHTLFL